MCVVYWSLHFSIQMSGVDLYDNPLVEPGEEQARDPLRNA